VAWAEHLVGGAVPDYGGAHVSVALEDVGGHPLGRVVVRARGGAIGRSDVLGVGEEGINRFPRWVSAAALAAAAGATAAAAAGAAARRYFCTAS
jgi:hypothetical protein